jgi:hypothetical protein
VAITLRLHALQKEAEKSGGALIRLLGNHEVLISIFLFRSSTSPVLDFQSDAVWPKVMNYSGDWRYVSGDWGDGWQPYEEELGPTLDGYDVFVTFHQIFLMLVLLGSSPPQLNTQL